MLPFYLFLHSVQRKTKKSCNCAIIYATKHHLYQNVLNYKYLK